MKIENLEQREQKLKKKINNTYCSKQRVRRERERERERERDSERVTMADHQEEEEVHERQDGNGDAVVPVPVVQLGFSVPIESAEHLEAVAHRSYDYNLWDGGQIGGLPVWLQPADIPTGPLHCLNPNCSAIMSFLCQLYAPVETINNEMADDDEEKEKESDRAFHRSLYVFGCSQCADKTVGSIRVLRAQLPEVNPFYPLAINEDDENDAVQEIGWQNHQPAEWNVKQCAVCGLAGKFKCPLQQLHFCGPEHQKEHKIYVFNQPTDAEQFLPSVYNLSELVVEREPDLPTDDDDDDGAGESNESKSKQSTMFDTNNDGESDSDEDLEQDDLNKMTGSSQTTQDSTTMAFYQRVKDRPNSQDQCLRYNRWPTSSDDNPNAAKQAGTPLWIHQDRQPPPPPPPPPTAAGDNNDGTDGGSTTTTTIPPPCPYCHAPRKFEFQLMPQLLHYLLQGRNDTKNKNKQAYSTKDESYESIKQAVAHADLMLQQAPPEHIPPALVDAKKAAVQKMQERLVGSGSAKEIDWGVVAVYTCTASCGSTSDPITDPVLGAYREEFAWKQPSLDA
jgi:pre-rRNA-processing protein TSR4